MKDPDKAIICGACKVPILGPSDPKPDAQMICPRCGARDTYKEVWKVCLEHIKHRLQSATKRGFAEFARQSKHPLPGASASDNDEPFFKWRIKD